MGHPGGSFCWAEPGRLRGLLDGRYGIPILGIGWGFGRSIPEVHVFHWVWEGVHFDQQPTPKVTGDL
jgi:hypothetical protein